MFNVVLSLIILACILLILIVLAQNSKGGGLTSQFGGSGASNMIGVKKTGDLLEKLTWGLITAVFVLTMATKFLMNDGGAGGDQFIDRAKENTTTVPALDLGGDSEATPAEGATEATEGDTGGSLNELNSDEDTE